VNRIFKAGRRLVKMGPVPAVSRREESVLGSPPARESVAGSRINETGGGAAP